MTRSSSTSVYQYTSILITTFLTVSLAACTTTVPPHGEGSGGHETVKPPAERHLTIDNRSTADELAFRILEGKRIFLDFGISHTKEMHMIVVRSDLRHFHHLHPLRDRDGTWRVPFFPPAGGTYWIFLDFVDKKGANYVIRLERTYLIDRGEEGIQKDKRTTKEVNDFRIAMKPSMGPSDVTFTYTITDRMGKSAELEEYLGAKGHSILLSPSGDFIHTHASTGDPTFATRIPEEKFYRIFAQFQIKGKVVTVDFDWERP